MGQLNHWIAYSALAVTVLAFAKPAHAQCFPAPAGFEICDLDAIAATPSAPEQGTLVISLEDDMWLDISALPSDLNAMSDDDVLDLLFDINAQDAGEQALSEISRDTLTAQDVSASARVISEQSDAGQSAFIMAVASRGETRLFLALDGGAAPEPELLSAQMQHVLDALRFQTES
ncbi:MAG: hypothetical protein GVY34_04140 [Alphaproteobacteria bacterium]|jgi:hypothetical protein|nr:hypothetical protein [Alphaproteobacteria bacterium]